MKKVTVVFGVLVLMALAQVAWPVSASFFKVDGAVEFRKGKLDDTVVVEPGRLTLAFEKKELLKAEGEIVWSLARGRAGAVYAGTSHKGKVYVIQAGKATVAGTVEDAAIFAVAVGPDGKLYFGGSPSGTIYRDGKVFCKTGQSYIWAMLFDERGNLYAATGPDGKLLRIDRAGTAAVVLDSSDPHIMSLAQDSKGNIYAGTNKSGLIYRVDSIGTSRIIYDAAECEIRALAVDEKDNVYFGTADVKAGHAARRGPVGMRAMRSMPTGGPPRRRESGKPSAAPPPRAAPTPTPIRDEVTATNAIYRFSPGGSVVKLYSIRGKMILSLLWTDGNLYAGTGNRGDLIRIDENLDVTVLEKDLERQVLSLLAGDKGAILMGTADAGRVIRYAAAFIKEGLYTSDVFDAKFAARFGAVTWSGLFPAGTSVSVITQTGNVAKPDASWSEWSKPCHVSGEKVTSPGARFIRYRVRLKTAAANAAPCLDEIKVAYLSSNQPPRVKAVKVLTPRQTNKGPGPAKPSAAGRRVQISWQAQDPNGDRMRYSVEFRMRGDVNWRTLEEKTDKAAYAWKTEAVPDGTYEVRIKASDEPGNPKETAMTHTRVSESFVVDNTRPQVTVSVVPAAAAKKAAVNVVMSDAAGIIKSAQYSLDSGDWQTLLSDDYILDSRLEKATVLLKDLKPGEHTITVRVTDENGNAGAGSRTFKVR